VVDEVRPNPTAVLESEKNGERIRVYLTANGSIASERLNHATGDWDHLPLAEAHESAVKDILALRFRHEDEEIARHIALCSRPQRAREARPEIPAPGRTLELACK